MPVAEKIFKPGKLHGNYAMKKLLIAVSIWFLAINCPGQEPQRINLLSLNYGVSYLTRQDLTFSPFIHSDLSPISAGIEFSRNAVLLQKVKLRYTAFSPMISKPYVYTEYGEHETAGPHYFTLIEADYLIGKTVKSTEKSNLSIGGILMADIHMMNYVYGRISSFGYYSALGLGVFAEKELVLNSKNRLSGALQLPLAVWLSRSPYLVNDDEFIENISSHSAFKTFLAFIGDGKPVTWNRLQTFDLEAGYIHSINNRWSMGAKYMYSFIHAAKPRNLLSYRHSLSVYANFNF